MRTGATAGVALAVIATLGRAHAQAQAPRTPPGPKPEDVPAHAAGGGTPSRPVIGEPFGPGAPLHLTATRPLDVYLVPGSGEIDPPSLHRFVKVGKTPLTVHLPRGLYTLELESPDATTASTTLEMGEHPKHLVARAGSHELNVIGTFTTALGLTAALTGVVVIAAFSEEPSVESKEARIGIPLIVAGAVLTAGGVTMYLVSRTTIEDTTPKDIHARPVATTVAMAGRF